MKGNSKSGLSNYRTRSLDTTISTAELKILSTFRSLPAGVWFTCRVVYFLFMAYYEYVVRSGKAGVVGGENHPSQSSLSALWSVLEKQQSEQLESIDAIETHYSWPLLQVIIERFPLQFTKLLNIIEHGANVSSPGKGKQRSPQRTSPTKSQSNDDRLLGDGNNNAAAVFYSSFPLSKLVLLRNIVKQGMWILSLIHI